MNSTCSNCKTKHIPVHKVAGLQLCDKCNHETLDPWGLKKHTDKELARQLAAKKGA